MAAQSLLAEHFLQYSQKSQYGSAQEGVMLIELLDQDGVRPIHPSNVGLEVDLSSIHDFMTEQGADPAHMRYLTVGLFPPTSKHAVYKDGYVGGFVDKSTSITGELGLRFPLIALQHDPDKPDPSQLNFYLRHEIAHLLRPEKMPPYNNERLIARLKAASATAASLLLPSAVNMFNRSEIIDALSRGVSVGEYMTSSVACMIGSLAAASMTYGLSFRPYGTMNMFAVEEYKANRFARRHADFQPFTAHA